MLVVFCYPLFFSSGNSSVWEIPFMSEAADEHISSNNFKKIKLLLVLLLAPSYLVDFGFPIGLGVCLY
jgi:hypothetical protein